VRVENCVKIYEFCECVCVCVCVCMEGCSSVSR